MFTLDFLKVSNSSLAAEDWHDEIENDIAFPMVDVKSVAMLEGFSPTEKDNAYMQALIYDEVMDALLKNEINK
jgi:hypothetical protein